MDISQRQCADGNWSSAKNETLGIVIHVAQGSLEGTAAWFATPPYKRLSRNASSAHYIVGKNGLVMQFVADNCQAYHAGINWTHVDQVGTAKFLKDFKWKNPNSYLIGIELEGFSVPHDGLPAEKITDTQYKVLCELVYGLAHKYFIPLTRDNIVTHGEIYAPKRDLCPGGYVDVDQMVLDLKKRDV